MNRHTIYGSILVLLLTCALSFAKGGLRPPSALVNSTQGREFYITFPTNLVDPSVIPNVLDLSCFIASNYSTKGTIQILGAGGSIVWQKNFTVDPQGVTQIGVPHQYNDQAEIQDAQDEIPITKAVHITTDQPVVVYGMSHRPYTADGYLAIPPSSWGTDYRVGGYYGVTPLQGNINAASELAVVAAYDSTFVNITLSAPTRDVNDTITHHKGDIVSVMLNKGQVYQMQAYTDPSAGGIYDLSMSEVQSSKPVGVFGGSKCADVPVGSVACDYVIEMMPPMQTWGKEFFTYQFDPARTGGDIWRVYPSQSNTVVTIDGVVMATTSPSDTLPWYEITDLNYTPLKNPAHWTFNKPVMMMQYITSENFDGSSNNPNVVPPRGDPSSVVLENREQYHTNIICALPPDSNGYTAPDGSQHINVFIDGGVSGTMQDSLSIDGNLVKHLPQPFIVTGELQVPNTTFWVLRIQVPGGMHHLQAKTGFSSYAVGFKSYESYAWPCGLSLNVVGTGDTNAPVLTDNALDCGVTNDTLTDVSNSIRSNLAQAGDDSSGIGWVYQGPYPDTTYNFNDAVLPAVFNSGDSLTPVHIQVTDVRSKAHGAFYAIDRAGNDTTYYFDYTPDSVTANPDSIKFVNEFNQGVFLDTITIKNPLSNNVNVDSIWLIGNKAPLGIASGGAPPSFVLSPGASRNLTVQFSWTIDTLPDNPLIDTIMIKFNCFSRPIGTVNIRTERTSVNERPDMPQNISLDQNAPNPFGEMTSVEYRIPNDEKITLNVYNALGRQVATLIDGFIGAGEHTATFNATGLPAGIYIARLQVGGAVVQRMMQVVK